MKVIIAVDSSEIAEKTFEWYLQNLHKDENEIVVCHEAEQPDFPTMLFAGAGTFPADEVHRIVEEHNRKCKKLQNRYKTKCQNSNISNYKVVVDTNMSSNPGHGIIKRANDINADMIVMGTRGLGSIRRTILGSVSDYVLHHAKIPVMICHL